VIFRTVEECSEPGAIPLGHISNTSRLLNVADIEFPGKTSNKAAHRFVKDKDQLNLFMCFEVLRLKFIEQSNSANATLLTLNIVKLFRCENTCCATLRKRSIDNHFLMIFESKIAVKSVFTKAA
jgi:hypothetical protein